MPARHFQNQEDKWEMRCKNSGRIKCSLPCIIASEKNKSNFMFIKSVPGNTVEVLLWNHHLKENKLKRHVFLFKRFLLKTSWSIWQHIFICFLNNICSKKAWKDLCHQPCGEVSLSLVKSSLQNSLKIKINNFTFWLIIGCWTVCRWNCFSSECLSLVQTDCVCCVSDHTVTRDNSNTRSTVGVVTEALELWC